MRLIGTTLIYPTVTYSPWFPRTGDAATFVLELLTTTIVSAGDFKVTVETKNTEQDDNIPAGQQTAFPSIQVPTSPTTVARTSKRVDGLLELVRFKFEWATSLTAGTFAHFRMLPPMWEVN